MFSSILQICYVDVRMYSKYFSESFGLQDNSRLYMELSRQS